VPPSTPKVNTPNKQQAGVQCCPPYSTVRIKVRGKTVIGSVTEPYSFVLGKKQIMSCIEEGVKRMKV